MGWSRDRVPGGGSEGEYFCIPYIQFCLQFLHTNVVDMQKNSRYAIHTDDREDASTHPNPNLHTQDPSPSAAQCKRVVNHTVTVSQHRRSCILGMLNWSLSSSGHDYHTTAQRYQINEMLQAACQLSRTWYTSCASWWYIVNKIIIDYEWLAALYSNMKLHTVHSGKHLKCFCINNWRVPTS